MITLDGETLSVNEWARRRGVSPRTITRRLRGGMTVRDAIHLPPDKNRGKRKPDRNPPEEVERLCRENLRAVVYLLRRVLQNAPRSAILAAGGHEELFSACLPILWRVARLYDPARGKFTTPLGFAIARRVPEILRLAQTGARKAFERRSVTDDVLYTYPAKASADVRLYLEALDARERDVVERHYFGGETLREIAANMGVTGERVGQIRFAALSKMRKMA